MIRMRNKGFLNAVSAPFLHLVSVITRAGFMTIQSTLHLLYIRKRVIFYNKKLVLYNKEINSSKAKTI